MLTRELEYTLPPGLIAQTPLYPRDHSRLLVYERRGGAIHHQRFPDLLSRLCAGDALVYNESRVLRARVAVVKPTGGAVELLFLSRRAPRLWEALVKPSARLKEGTALRVAPPAAARLSSQPGLSAGDHFLLKENLGTGRWLVKNVSGLRTGQLLEQVGEMPLPPYIKEELREPERYQTVYSRQTGSAAAPTAGLHFTPQLLGKIRDMGVQILPLTLHVGLDTFRPVSEEDIDLHQIHRESYLMPAGTRDGVLAARKRGGRIIAVGTTAVRVLETVFGDPQAPLEGETGLLITPGHRFAAVDALLTNFHLPRSTLLALVMAFTGVEATRRIYAEAVSEKYRFYSFGDAMLVV